MGILSDIGDIGSGIAGYFGAKKNNIAAKDALLKQQGLAGQQIDIAGLIQQLTKEFASQGSGYTDAFGGGTRYDPATGTWKATLGAGQQAIQSSSDAEELARNSYDAQLRRSQLSRADQGAQAAFGEADTARRQYDQFNQGIGAVDPNKLASQLRLNRTSAVNAGYDDAMKAAGTISLRTGASAGDALSNLARSRSSAIFQAQGDPELEALTAAEGINSGRRSNILGGYNMFNNAGTGIGTDTFNPSTYGSTATDNLFKTQALDQSKFNLANEGYATAAAGIGSAAAGLRGATDQNVKNTNNAALAQLIKGLGKSGDSLVSSISGMIK